MIRVVEHDPAWAKKYEIEAARIERALGETAVRIHHIGSTAILQIRAKPIVDILLEVTTLDALDGKSSMLEALRYEAKGAFGIPGRRYFRLDDSEGTRTHQVHAFEMGVPNVTRHLCFRDYMRGHPSIAEEYGALKQHLADTFPNDAAAYMDGKDAFVKEHENHALRWAGHADVPPAA